MLTSLWIFYQDDREKSTSSLIKFYILNNQNKHKTFKKIMNKKTPIQDRIT